MACDTILLENSGFTLRAVFDRDEYLLKITFTIRSCYRSMEESLKDFTFL